MDRETELSLLDELLGLSEQKSAYLDESVTQSEVSKYTDPGRFEAEMTAIFRKKPVIACHASELPEAGSFLRRDLARQPMLLTRDRDGVVHAFLNVCRHRGARLVDDDHGCKFSFSCPYHAWTWSNSGDLRGIPHQQQGFPDLDKSDYGLTRLQCAERFGWIWVVPQPGETPDIDAYLEPLATDMRWLETESLRITNSDTITCDANWKLLVEGGIEAYHFKTAHAATIGPYFPDNLSTYRTFGPHMRSILPRIGLGQLPQRDRDTWDLRKEANVLYSIFPSSQWLVQQDHIVWIRLDPISADQTRLFLATLAPSSEIDRADHWDQNHRITMTTLREDFQIGEAVQAGLRSGANTHLTFGRYEGALHRFALTVDEALDARQPNDRASSAVESG